MAKIGLTDGYPVIPVGTHIFRITDVKYKEDFGKLEITLQTKGGSRHIERFSLLKNDGSPNEGAYNAFSFFAKTALQDYELTEIDHTDLIGRFIECDVEHEEVPNKNKPGKTITFSRLTEKRPSDGWEETTPAPVLKTAPVDAVPTKPVGKKPSFNLADILD